MPKTRIILELGSGNDLHGSDYTKAALRAVQDALHHSSLSFIRSLEIDKRRSTSRSRSACSSRTASTWRRSRPRCRSATSPREAVKGGLDIAGTDDNDTAVIASAAIAVRVELA